ncbi:transcriptional regulator [Pedobacter sp. SYP-B3415]|uniref:transcriptional regulator n=1 Tax=Pedobacter sp. SYP-B3415 TaxID=2496641 RepID=UPI00101CB4AF|nr:transcriptional regulator [Pedobacter sp. SYP-B3415]
MKAIITGDVINSRQLEKSWLNVLKSALRNQAASDKYWEIFRGDSFQLQVDVDEALYAAFYIKASMRTIKNGDIRMGIGIGNVSRQTAKLTEAMGEAFINSGKAFDQLEEQKNSLSFVSPDTGFDKLVNLMISLVLIAADNWSPVMAETVKIAMENKSLVQAELATKMSKSQSSVSEALKRAYYQEVMNVDYFYREELNKMLPIWKSS